MIIVGERLNSTRSSIKEAIAGKDVDFLIKEAESQIQSGASFIDINCASSMANEEKDLLWLMKEVQGKFGCSVSIDSPNTEIIKSVLPEHSGKPFINSITIEKDKIESMSEIYKEKESNIIGLTIDDNGMPNDVEGRVEMARKIVDYAQSNQIRKEDIFIDPLVKPISTEPDQVLFFLEAAKTLRSEGINIIGGLSNVSFGLPRRGIINAVFLKLCIESGIDAFIIDPTAELIKMVLDGKDLPREQSLLAEDVILGKDQYAMNYIKAFRDGALNL